MEPCTCGELTCPTCGFGPVISAYTRADALADGTLIDVSEAAREVGIVFPTAITREAWGRCVAVPDGVVGQDERGRLHDVAWMLRCAIVAGRGDETILFEFYLRNDNHRARLTRLKAICGPSDDGSPCVTICEPDQD